jgi:peptide/nickel transport system permease protein
MDRGAARRRSIRLLGQVHIPMPEARYSAYPHELSGGMRQRVVIAMALANDPPLLIADEATTALDVTVQGRILEVLNELCEARGAALVFISHDLGVVRGLCQRTLVMYAGRVVEEAPTASLLSRPLHPYTRALLDSVPELGRPGKRLTPIAGLPPPLNRLPEGCHFAPRCPHAREQCRAEPLRLRSVSTDRAVRCTRAEEIPPWRR